MSPPGSIRDATHDDRLSAPARSFSISVGVLLVALGAIYLPSVGHGFVKDDFVWIARSRLETWADAAALFGAPTGFFRPLVSLSFGINRWLCGVHPLCYGAANFALMLGGAAGVYLVARALSLPRGAALLSAALWAFNWHGVNMAVLWISGRTALIVVLFATLAAAAFIRQRYWLALALSVAAMLSKEEAVLLPFVLIVWRVLSPWRSWRWRGLAQFAAGSAAVEVLYFFLRGRSGAFTPATAPPFYHLSFTFERLATNLPAYVDRSMTFTAVVLLLWVAICRPGGLALRAIDRSVIRFGVLWWMGALALTVFVPVRSSLYACLPSVGVAIAAAAIVTGAWPSIDRRLQSRAIWIALAIPFLTWPVYHSRNGPSVREAELSSQTIQMLRAIAAERGEGTIVLLRDDRAARSSLDNAFGTVLQDAVNVTVAPPIQVWIEPPPVDAALAGLTAPPRFDAELVLQRGRLTRVR